MANWDQNKLIELINNQQEENTQYEYKAAAALELTDSKKSEIRKDVSAMANAAGGIIIYGMNEDTLQDGRTVPVSLDNVATIGTKTESIYQVLNSVQRRIEGVNIVTVECPSIGGYVYVVEIPESNTIHMADARTGRYYKRAGNQRPHMEDYEVRMGLNRVVYPYLEIDFRWGQDRIGDIWGRGMIAGQRLTCTLRHAGGPLAEKMMLEIEFPSYWPPEHRNTLWIPRDFKKEGFTNFVAQTSVFVPLFPEQKFEFHLSLRDDFWQQTGGGGSHQTEEIKWMICADSATPRRGQILGSSIPHER